MRLPAVLVDEHGRRHELVHRKGSHSTLLGAGGEPVDERLLDGMLGAITREVFESKFSITHESLVVGSKALLAADGNLGESLFGASLGATEGGAAEARGLFEPLLAERERILGATHPTALNTRHNLALAYRAAGRDAEAAALEEGPGGRDVR